MTTVPVLSCSACRVECCIPSLDGFHKGIQLLLRCMIFCALSERLQLSNCERVILRRFNYEGKLTGRLISILVDADDAIIHLEARPEVRVIFSDIEMSGSMDGLKLIHLVRRRWPPVMLILASGRGSPLVDDAIGNGVPA